MFKETPEINAGVSPKWGVSYKVWMRQPRPGDEVVNIKYGIICMKDKKGAKCVISLIFTDRGVLIVEAEIREFNPPGGAQVAEVEGELGKGKSQLNG